MELSQWAEWWEQTGEDELSTLLMVLWDPIDVSDAPEAWGEYDNYVPPLGRRLREGATVDEIARHLAQLEHERLRSRASPVRLHQVAAQLIEWHAGSTSRFARNRGWDL